MKKESVSRGGEKEKAPDVTEAEKKLSLEDLPDLKFDLLYLIEDLITDKLGEYSNLDFSIYRLYRDNVDIIAKFKDSKKKHIRFSIKISQL